MIAVDACVVIYFLEGADRAEVDAFAALLANDQAVLAPSTITELLSDPKGGAETATLIDGLGILPLEDGYWGRAGLLRAKVRRSGRKAALGDVLVAQTCLDSNVSLLTSDTDFKVFAEIAHLRLAA